jgi:hypothetical protein
LLEPNFFVSQLLASPGGGSVSRRHLASLFVSPSGEIKAPHLECPLRKLTRRSRRPHPWPPPPPEATLISPRGLQPENTSDGGSGRKGAMHQGATPVRNCRGMRPLASSTRDFSRVPRWRSLNLILSLFQIEFCLKMDFPVGCFSAACARRCCSRHAEAPLPSRMLASIQRWEKVFKFP